MSFNLLTKHELKIHIATRFRDLRTFKNLTRKTLSEQSGVSEASIKRFERTGEIALSSLINLAFTLNALDAFEDLFSLPQGLSLDDIARKDSFQKKKVKKRGRL